MNQMVDDTALLLRCPVSYYGGNGRLASRLLPLIPAGGRPYVEPYCGGASVFFARPRADHEVINDIDGDLIGLYRCLQARTAFEALRRQLLWTPYSLSEFRWRQLGVREPGGIVPHPCLRSGVVTARHPAWGMTQVRGRLNT